MIFNSMVKAEAEAEAAGAQQHRRLSIARENNMQLPS